MKAKPAFFLLKFILISSFLVSVPLFAGAYKKLSEVPRDSLGVLEYSPNLNRLYSKEYNHKLRKDIIKDSFNLVKPKGYKELLFLTEEGFYTVNVSRDSFMVFRKEVQRYERSENYIRKNKSKSKIQFGYADLEGNTIIPARYENIFKVDADIKGLIGVEDKGLYGFYDKKGKLVINTEYDFIIPVDSIEGVLCKVKQGFNYGWIDKDYKVHFDPKSHKVISLFTAPNIVEVLKLQPQEQLYGYYIEDSNDLTSNIFAILHIADIERDYNGINFYNMKNSLKYKLCGLKPGINYIDEDWSYPTSIQINKVRESLNDIFTFVYNLVKSADRGGYFQKQVLVAADKDGEVLDELVLYNNFNRDYDDYYDVSTAQDVEYLNDSVVSIKGYKYNYGQYYGQLGTAKVKTVYKSYSDEDSSIVINNKLVKQGDTIEKYVDIFGRVNQVETIRKLNTDSKTKYKGNKGNIFKNDRENHRNYAFTKYRLIKEEDTKIPDFYYSEPYAEDMEVYGSPSTIEYRQLTELEASMMMYEIYADYNCKFTDKMLERYFSRKNNDYEPLHDNVDDKLSEIDKKNIAFLKRYLEKLKNKQPIN